MSTSDPPDLRQFAEEAQRSATRAEEELHRLGCRHSVPGLFAASVAVMGRIRGEVSEATHGDMPSKIEKLAYHLWRCPSGTEPLTIEAIRTAIRSADQIAHGAMWRFPPTADTGQSRAPHLLSHLQVDVEGIRGSAYPEQISSYIVAVAGKHDGWFRSRLQTSVRHLVDATWGIAFATSVQANKWLKTIPGRDIRAYKRGADDPRGLTAALQRAEEVLPVSFAGLAALSADTLTPETWDALIELIGLRVEDARAATSWLCARARPLFVMPDRRVLLVGLPHALDRLAESLEQVAKTDQAFFSKFQETKARWLEREVHESLTRVFGEDATYQSLTYPDPDRPGEPATAEIDAIVSWPPFLVLVEAKARQFRLEGQLGDLNKLRTDLRANVEDAFSQAKRAQRYIASCDRAVFKESGSGRSLEVAGEKLQRTYIITATAFNLGNAINRMANLRELQLFSSAEYPWAVSCADLQVIAGFSEGPDVFLHYLERRREIEQHPERFPINDDLDLFAAYLKTRLLPDRFPRDGFIWLTGWQERFDQYFEHLRGMRTKPPEIQLQLPPIVRDTLDELRKRTNDEPARWIAFSLLGLSDGQLDHVARLIEDAKRQMPAVGIYRHTALLASDLAVVAVVARGVPKEQLADRVLKHATVEKYRHRAAKCIGFGFLGSHGVAFDYCVWLDRPWEANATLDALIEQEKPLRPVPGQQLSGRNAPCICGSGRKFKKCCLVKMETRE